MSYTHVLNKPGLGGRSPLGPIEPLPAASADHPRTDVIRKIFALSANFRTILVRQRPAFPLCDRLCDQSSPEVEEKLVYPKAQRRRWTLPNGTELRATAA